MLSGEMTNPESIDIQQTAANNTPAIHYNFLNKEELQKN
jgi:hypothetical protein